MSNIENSCALLVHNASGEGPSVTELKNTLETGKEEQQIKALKQVITYTVNGEDLSNILMTIIRFVLPRDNHTIKKLLLLFWEVTKLTDENGKLKPEIILVCNNLRNDLIHPNEYVRGSTLRFLTKLKEPEVLEPLLPSIEKNLEHRHSYVRRNAVLALYHIYKNFDELCPDAPQMVYNFLLEEGDASCKRNAFLMLFNTDQEKAVEYLSTVLDQVVSFGEILQLIVIEVIRKVARTYSQGRSHYIKCIFTLLGSSSPSVQFDAAATLILLSSAPSAIKAACSTYIHLLCTESDNNVKMIILDKLLALKQKYPKVLQELIMDILRAISSPNMDVRRKTLEIALDLVSTKNINEVILALKNEINKSQGKEEEKGGEYRQLLIQAIHTCAVKFPEVASNVIHLLMDFIGDSNVSSAVDVVSFVREIMTTYPELRESLLQKLLNTLNQVKASVVLRASLWILGEFSQTPESLENAFEEIKRILGDVPFLTQETEQEEDQLVGEISEKSSSSGANKVLADGTYATQSAVSEVSSYLSMGLNSSVSETRKLLFSGDFFLAAAICSTITKIALKYQRCDEINPEKSNQITANTLLIMTSLIRLGQSGKTEHKIDPDSFERICFFLTVLLEGDVQSQDVLLSESIESFTLLLKETENTKPNQEEELDSQIQPDTLIKIRQLRPKRSYGNDDFEDEDDIQDLDKATGILESQADKISPLKRVYQLSGLCDPIYAEAFVNVHQYDIVLDVLVINQTQDTFQNVSLELATLGDLKLCERPQNYTIGPKQEKTIQANIKVSSTETGIIFGNIVYDVAGSGASDRDCVILNDIHIDIMDYISPASCSDTSFRTMWAEFEWENKVGVNAQFDDVNSFLQHIVKATNMRCLTPASALAGECSFLTANLYARSVFGEDALANVSIEKTDDKVTGYIRIRSQTQGIALSLGDKITLESQKQNNDVAKNTIKDKNNQENQDSIIEEAPTDPQILPQEEELEDDSAYLG